MFRVLPERWWGMVVLTVLAALVAGSISGRYKGLTTFLETGDPGILRATALGASIGLGLGVIALLAQVGSDTRHLVLAERFPEAIVVSGWRIERETFEAMQALSLRRTSPPEGVTTFGVVFDVDAVSIYFGARDPRLFSRIPWSDVEALAVGDLYKGSAVKATVSVHRLHLVVRGPWGLVDIPFGVSLLGSKNVFRSAFHDERELTELVASVNQLRRIAPSRGASSALFGKALLPGATAWSLSRINVDAARLVIWALSIPVAALAGVGLVGVSLVAGSIILLSQLVLFVLRRAARRAVRRERDAGYTTLNGVQLDREQRHPKTGRVIRQAGAPPLTASQFADALESRL